MGPSPSLWFLHSKQRLLEQNYKSVWDPDLTCRFVYAKQRDLHKNIKSVWVPALICGFVHSKHRLYNQNYMTLWVPDLTSGFVNAKQRSSTRMTTLYGFQPFTCGFGCKTAWFAPEWQDYIASSHHLWFCVCKTAPLGLELQVSVGQRPHLCYCMQNSDFWSRITSLYGSQTSSVVLSTHNWVLNTKIKRLYWFQPSPVVLCMQNSDFRTRITSL